MDGPSWQVIALGAIGLLFTVIGAVIARVDRRVNALDDNLDKLRLLVAQDYHSKNELNIILSEVKQSISALHRRFDSAGFPHRSGMKDESY